MKQLPEKAEILKSKMQCGNTVIAAAAEVFKISNSTKDIRFDMAGSTIDIWNGQKFVAYDWYVTADKFLFLLAR